MTVAALYDVHGNLPALEAVLAEVGDADTIVVGGDVAAGPWPAETIDRLRGLGDRVLWVRGNADRELAERDRQGMAPPELLAWMRERLSFFCELLHMCLIRWHAFPWLFFNFHRFSLLRKICSHADDPARA